MDGPRFKRSKVGEDIHLWLRYRDITGKAEEALEQGDRRKFRFYSGARQTTLAALLYLLEREIEHELMAASAVTE